LNGFRFSSFTASSQFFYLNARERGRHALKTNRDKFRLNLNAINAPPLVLACYKLTSALPRITLYFIYGNTTITAQGGGFSVVPPKLDNQLIIVNPKLHLVNKITIATGKK
jgi:hypothetical protein